MIELLTNYSLGQILVFVAMLAIALKEAITFFEWLHDKAKKRIQKEQQPENISEKFKTVLKEKEEQLSNITAQMDEIQSSIHVINDKLQMLIASDKDAIKAWLTAQHHHFMDKGIIDYYSFDCISRRYQHYKEQGGNTFIDDLMEDINNLPKEGDKKNIHNI